MSEEPKSFPCYSCAEDGKEGTLVRGVFPHAYVWTVTLNHTFLRVEREGYYCEDCGEFVPAGGTEHPDVDKELRSLQYQWELVRPNFESENQVAHAKSALRSINYRLNKSKLSSDREVQKVQMAQNKCYGLALIWKELKYRSGRYPHLHEDHLLANLLVDDGVAGWRLYGGVSWKNPPTVKELSKMRTEAKKAYRKAHRALMDHRMEMYALKHDRPHREPGNGRPARTVRSQKSPNNKD